MIARSLDKWRSFCFRQIARELWLWIKWTANLTGWFCTWVMFSFLLIESSSLDLIRRNFAASRLAFPCLVLPGVCLGLATIVCDRMQMNCSPTKYLVFSSRVMTWGEGRRGVTKQAYQYTLRLNSWPQFAWNIVGWRQRSSYVGDLCSFSYSRSWHCAIIEEISQQTQR